MKGKSRKKCKRPAFDSKLSSSLDSRKRPSTGSIHPHPEKRPSAQPPPDPSGERPSWRVTHLELVDPFGWHAMGRDKMLEIRQKMAGFESLTWHEILVTAKSRNHSISLDQLARNARDRLGDLFLDDRDELISLRLGGRERVWGFRQGSVFSLLWWDPEHQVCPSHKRHT